MKLLSLKIDVTKIDKAKLYKGKKGTYLDLTIALADEKDQHGNDVSCWQEQTKEEREKKADRNFLGNGKVFWKKAPEVKSQPEEYNPDDLDEIDDLPF